MAATTTKDRAAKAEEQEAAKARERDKAAKAKAKEKAAKAKAKEKAAKAREKQKAAKAKEKEKAAKAKEKAAKAKEKDRATKAKEKEKAAKAKAKEKEKAAKAKAKEQAAKAKAEEQAAKAEEKDRAATARAEEQADRTAPAPAPETVAQAPETEQAAPAQDALPELDVPANDKTIRPKGYLAEALGREDAVERATQRATLAASYLTRDHDVIRAWAQTRGGRPADVAGTGRSGGAGVLRIEFPDGPGDDSRLEDIDWAPFFQTFDDSDVDFLYQERVRTGDVSRFHKIVRADS